MSDVTPERRLAQIIFDALIREKFMDGKTVDFVRGIDVLEEELKLYVSWKLLEVDAAILGD